jgi:hypothetical protein
MHSPVRLALAASAALTPVLALAPSAGAAPAPVAAYASCGTVKDVGPTGMDPADAVALRAKVASCRTARVIARRWARASVTQGGETVTVGAYRCRQTTSGDRIVVRCTARGGRVVRFKLG